MSVTGFAFLSPDSGGAALHTYYPLLTLMTLPSPCYISERRPQTHRTSRLNHWATDTSLWWFLKECKRKKTRSYHLGSSSLTPDCEPSSYKNPRLLGVRRGDTVLEAWTYFISFSANWELKPPFYYLQTLSPYTFFQWAEKANILANNSYVHTHTHTYTHTQIYACVCACMCVRALSHFSRVQLCVPHGL